MEICETMKKPLRKVICMGRACNWRMGGDHKGQQFFYDDGREKARCGCCKTIHVVLIACQFDGDCLTVKVLLRWTLAPWGSHSRTARLLPELVFRDRAVTIAVKHNIMCLPISEPRTTLVNLSIPNRKLMLVERLLIAMHSR